MRAERDHQSDKIKTSKLYMHQPRMREADAVFVLFGLVLVIVMFVLGMTIKQGDPSDALVLMLWVSLECALLLLIAWHFIMRRAREIWRSEIVSVRCQRCPECYCDLSGRAIDEARCSECGTHVTRRECVRLWARLIRGKNQFRILF